MALSDTPSDLIPDPLARPHVAGFWRRVVAFLLDALALGVLGQILGAVFFDSLVHLGPWGRLLGFVIALMYFSLQESRLGGGRSLGKRALDLRVIDASGAAPSVVRALARSAIFCVPYFLNGAALPPGVAMGAAGVALAVLVFGGGLSMAYLLIFNRRTRQSLHDLATGTFVVTEAAAAPTARVWRGHLVVVAALLVAAAATPSIARRALRIDRAAGMMTLYERVAALPGVKSATVVDTTNTRFGSGGEATQHVLVIQPVIESAVEESGLLATHVAGVALATYPGAAQEDRIVVHLLRGFDIGIASRWQANEFAKSPEQWRDRVAADAPG